MLKKRIIACLDIMQGRTVKGINFRSIRDAGDPVELAQLYAESGADELVFLDITATAENRGTQISWVRQVAIHLNIPFAVGGGISHLGHATALLEAGADKVTINSTAVRQPGLIGRLADKFGSQCVVVAIDAKREKDGTWGVYVSGGKQHAGRLAVEWAKEAEARGAGEILLTSMDADGTRSGFDLPLCQAVSNAVNVPVIASGGAGNMKDFQTVFGSSSVSGALAASIFHFGMISIPQLKLFLSENSIPVRI